MSAESARKDNLSWVNELIKKIVILKYTECIVRYIRRFENTKFNNNASSGEA